MSLNKLENFLQLVAEENGRRGHGKDSKHEKHLTHHCWLEDRGGQVMRNVGGNEKFRVAPADSHQNGDLSHKKLDSEGSWKQVRTQVVDRQLDFGPVRP